jgi:hypothetical protein
MSIFLSAIFLFTVLCVPKGKGRSQTGEATVGLFGRGRIWLFGVRDNLDGEGIGMTPNTLARIATEILRVAFAFVVLSLVLLFGNTLVAQSPSPTAVDPAVFGLQIPAGPVRAGGGRRVTTTDEAGKPIVAKVHVEVGDYQIVMLPDGQLVPRRSSTTGATDRPFTAATKDEIAAELTAGPFKGFKTNQTRRYLYVYNTSETFALAASRILETMFPGVTMYAESQKIETREPDVPLVVIMFRTEDEYQQFQRMPPGMVAYYNVISNHVVMYEESKLAGIKPDLAIRQSLATIAHEGAHQILHNIGVQQRLSMWPMWLSEGLAEFFAPTTTDEKFKWKGAGQVNDLRMFELEQYLKSRAAENPNGEMVQYPVIAERLTSTGYAAAWALTHYLAKNQRVEFHKYVNEISRTGPLEGHLRVVPPGIIPENLLLFKKYFGEDLVEIERRLVLHLKKQPYTDPFADWPHYLAMIIVPEGTRTRRDATSFRSPLLAQQWSRDMLDKLPDDQRTASQAAIREFPNRAAADRFASQWLRGR